MGDKEKLVLGEMAGDGEGPHGVAVQGAVDAVEDFRHGQSIDQGGSNDNGKIFLGEGARELHRLESLCHQSCPNPQTHSPQPLIFFSLDGVQGKRIIL